MKIHSNKISVENLIQRNFASVNVYHFLGSILGMAPFTYKSKMVTIKLKYIKLNLYYYLMTILYSVFLCYTILQMKNDGDMKMMNAKCISCICLILVLNTFVGILTNTRFPLKYFHTLAEIDLDFTLHNIELNSTFYRIIYLKHLNYVIYLIVSSLIKITLLLLFIECDVNQQIMLTTGSLCKTYASHALTLTLFNVHLRFNEINEIVMSTRRENVFRKKINHGE